MPPLPESRGKRIEHPVFSDKVAPSTPLWRYFDFPKFTSLLATRSLYFCRADLLGDPLEGSATRARMAERRRLLDNPPDGKTREELEAVFRQNSRIFERERRCAYVNCWHAGEHESMAMWQGYGGGAYGIVIQTTFGRLDEALPGHFRASDHDEPLLIGPIRYIDYTSEVDNIPDEYNLFGIFMAKSVAYRHENEVRAIFTDYAGWTGADAPAGHLVPIDPNTLVASLTVSPLAPVWFEELVVTICLQFGFRFPCRKSIAAMQPIY